MHASAFLLQRNRKAPFLGASSVIWIFAGFWCFLALRPRGSPHEFFKISKIHEEYLKQIFLLVAFKSKV
jgi:hypothetical protein